MSDGGGDEGDRGETGGEEVRECTSHVRGNPPFLPGCLGSAVRAASEFGDF